MTIFSDPRAFLARIERHLARISELGRGGEYATYVIKDPRGGDPRDQTDGDPFYVGQTSDLGRRARQHFRKGGAATNGGSATATRIHAILAAGKMPVFEVVEWALTRAASLESETRWAKKLRKAGYDLTNRWSEHRSAHLAAQPIPIKRLWNFTLEQAENDNIAVRIHCVRCGLEQPLPLGDLISRSRATLSLADVRRVIVCPNCGNRPCIEIEHIPAAPFGE
jgi:hypothetical protein